MSILLSRLVKQILSRYVDALTKRLHQSVSCVSSSVRLGPLVGRCPLLRDMSDITKENEVLRMMFDDDVEMCVYDGRWKRTKKKKMRNSGILSTSPETSVKNTVYTQHPPHTETLRWYMNKLYAGTETLCWYMYKLISESVISPPSTSFHLHMSALFLIQAKIFHY